MHDLPGYADLPPLLPTDGELRLRCWTAEDAGAVLAVCSTPRASAFAFPGGYDEERARSFVLSAPDHWAERNHLRLCLTDASGAVLGSGDIDDLSTRHGRGEFGWWIAPERCGRGLGSRLGRLLVRSAFEVLGLDRVEARIVAGNTASRFLASQAGLHLESSAASYGVYADERQDMETWRLLRDEPPLARLPELRELREGGIHLRPWRPEDAPRVLEICQDPEIQQWTSAPSPYLLADAERFTSVSTLTKWARDGTPCFAVCDADGLPVAAISAMTRGARQREIGFWCAAEARGAGVVTRSARLMLQWLFDTTALPVDDWRTKVGNTASRRVAEKLGFTMTGIERRMVSDGRAGEGWQATLLRGELT